MEDLQSRLKDKSIEAFLLAIEIYNKPTIKYRVEGFALFIVNAWELMLKSYLIKKEGESSIYFPEGVSRILCPGSFSRAAKLTALLFKDSVCHDCVGGVR